MGAVVEYHRESKMKECAMRVLPAAIALAMAGTAGVAQGSGFQLMEQNASGLGNAYAGQAAAAENASTIFWNPAGMTRLPGRQVSGALNLIKPSAEFSAAPGTSHPLGLPPGPGGNDGGDAGDLALVPNAYLSWQLHPRVWLGLGVTVPFGLKTEYDLNFIGRFQGQLAEIKTIDVNPSIAFKLNDVVSLGAGISYQRAEVKLNRSAMPVPPTESRIALDIDDDSWGYNLGAMFTLGPATRIGVTYRSSIEHDLTGTLSFSNVPVAGTATNGVRLSADLPDTLSVALAHQLNPAWELLADATYTKWSQIKALPLVTTSASLVVPAAGVTVDTFNFQFKDTWRIGVGANWKWRDDLTWKFGVAYDKSPVTDTFRTVTLPDSDRTWVAIGGKYQMSKRSTLDFGYAHLFIKDASINQQRGVGAAPLQGNVIGNYKASVDILSVQFSYDF
jgi:long-chain fatty acid transport protein